MDLPPPPPVPELPGGQDVATITAINDAGLVAVWTNGQAFVYTSTSGYTLLAPSSSYSDARHVNALGRISGDVCCVNGGYVPTYWTTPTTAIPLPTIAGNSYAMASNAAGLVVGYVPIGRVVLWNLAPPPPTPQQQVAALGAALTSFVSSSLIDAKDAKGLTSKLDAINASLGKGDSPSSKNVLKALGNQVDALQKSGRISATTAASLRDLVNAALATL